MSKSKEKVCQQCLDLIRDLEIAKKQIEQWKDASGLECGGDPDGVTPAKAKKFWDAETKRVEAFQEQAIEYQTDIIALRHDLDVAEYERDEARKELGEWQRAHSQPRIGVNETNGKNNQ